MYMLCYEAKLKMTISDGPFYFKYYVIQFILLLMEMSGK